jgi:hypothetical protein
MLLWNRDRLGGSPRFNASASHSVCVVLRAASGFAGDSAILSAAGFLYSAVRSNLFYWELVGFTCLLPRLPV